MCSPPPAPQNIRRDKKAIRDSKLYLIVAALLAVDGAVLLGWALVSPFRMAISEQGQFVSTKWGGGEEQ